MEKSEFIESIEENEVIVSRSPLKLMMNRFKKNKRAMVGLVMVTLFVIIAIFAPWIAPKDPYEQNLDVMLQSPSLQYFFGTDEFGRDIFSRVIYGSRISLMIGIVGVTIAIAIGVTLGTISGYAGGIVDTIIMRLMDILMAFPSFLLAMAIVSVLGPGMTNLMIAIGIFSIPTFARMSRGAVLDVKGQEYIEAAKALGGTSRHIIWKHVLPNTLSPIIVLSTLRIATAILTAAGLSFLGMGAKPPMPEWGAMLSTGRDYLRIAPHVSTIPGLAIMFMVLSFNMLGDGLRDALDTKSK